MRSGVIVKKLGMTRLFTETGESVSVSVLQLIECCVVSHKTLDKDGYSALQPGAGYLKTKNISKAQIGHFAASKVEPKRKLVEFRVSEDNIVPIGTKITCKHFSVGQYVDITGKTLGKGTAGPMVAWGFGGLRATHGVSLSHRSHGSTGGRQDPGKTFKNKKMACRLGNETVTIQNLQIIQVDEDRDIILVKGSVPGFSGNWLTLKDAIKKH